MPVQLVLLHLRKYRLLLVFWLILYFTITGNLAAHFGASSLFLAPEYLGHINFTSMFLLGGSLCVFMMTWHITTFIVHSKRMPYMGATRQAFIVYSINNSVIPVIFLFFYEFISVRFLKGEEGDNLSHILLLELGFLLGLTFVTFLSFAYFFSVSRDSLKVAISRITNPVRIRDIVPYDSLDYEIDIIPARSYISGKLRIERSTDLEPYHPRVMNAVLRRHHRNVIFGTFMCFIVLIVLGTFKEQPLLRVPAGCGFLLLFSIIMSLVAALRYFLKSWETIGWILLLLSLSALVQYKLFDMRSYAYGINYRATQDRIPKYDYPGLKKVFTPALYHHDLEMEEQRLDRWKSKISDEAGKPPAIIITVSGGGSRSAYWSFRALQYVDSITHGALFRHTVMITGASGGMIGATYWRNLHAAAAKNTAIPRYGPALQENIGKDLLNSIIFSMASVDVISPLSRVTVGNYEYPRGRGYAFEQEMIRNTDSMLDGSVGYWSVDEQAGISPRVFIAGTIVNDGRKLLINGAPASFLSQPCYSVNYADPQIDAVDFATFFSAQDASGLRIATALRMNATFPFILPVVKLPSEPMMNIMDAGLRDNFGSEIASRYLFALRHWFSENAGNIIQIDIRDTRENFVGSPFAQNSLMGMVADPIFAIQNKWEAFQSFNHSYVKDLSPSCISGKLSYVTLRYMPRDIGKNAELNFHLTQKEKLDIHRSMENPENAHAAKLLVRSLMEFYETD